MSLLASDDLDRAKLAQYNILIIKEFA